MNATTPSEISAEIELQIPFHDVDLMQIVWHGHYAKYFEQARSALLRKIDYDVPEMILSGIGWPVVDLQVKYIKPIAYGQKIKVIASIVDSENRLKIAYRVIDLVSGETLTKGHTIQFAIDMKTRQTLFETPEILKSKIKAITN